MQFFLIKPPAYYVDNFSLANDREADRTVPMIFGTVMTVL
jgi:hypothetical protein